MKTRAQVFQIIIGLCFLLFYTPRIPFTAFVSSSTSIRLDTIVSLLTSVLIISYTLTKKLTKGNLFVFLFAAILLFQGESGIFEKAATFLHYISIILFLYLIVDVRIYNYEKLLKKFNFFVFFNVAIHFIFLLFDLNYSITNSLGQNNIIGAFGVLHAPYNFTLLVFSGFIIEYYLHRKLFTPKTLVLFVAIIFAYSRITFGATIICILLIMYNDGLLKAKNIFSISIGAIFVFAFQSSVPKSFEIFNFFKVSISEDPSLGMRLINIERYIEWLDFYKILFGGGARAYTLFATQYGQPGPFDNIYLRVLSEVGIVGVMVIAFYLYILSKKMNLNIQLKIYFMFLLIFGLFNESALSIKGAQIVLISTLIIKGIFNKAALQKN